MLNTTKDIHVIRDATRGGVGTVLYEIAAQSKVGIHLDSQAIPVDPAVRGVCGMLGLNPYTWPAKAVWSSLPRRKSPAISSPS